MGHPGALSASIGCIYPEKDRVILGIANCIKVYAAGSGNNAGSIKEAASILAFPSQAVRGVVPIGKGHFLAYSERQVAVLHRDYLTEGGIVSAQRVHSFACAISAISKEGLDCNEVYILFEDSNCRLYRITVDKKTNIKLAVTREAFLGTKIASASAIQVENCPKLRFCLATACGRMVTWDGESRSGTGYGSVPDAKLVAVAMSGQGAAAVLSDGRIALLNLNDQSAKATHQPVHQSTATAIAISRCHVVVSGDDREQISVSAWNEKSGNDVTREMMLCHGPIRTIHYALSTNHFYIGSTYGPPVRLPVLKLWRNDAWGPPVKIQAETMDFDLASLLTFSDKTKYKAVKIEVKAIYNLGSGVKKGLLAIDTQGLIYRSDPVNIGSADALPSLKFTEEMIESLPANLDLVEAVSEIDGVVAINRGDLVYYFRYGQPMRNFGFEEKCLRAVAESDGTVIACLDSGGIVLAKVTVVHYSSHDRDIPEQKWLRAPVGTDKPKITALKVIENQSVFAGTSDGGVIYWDITNFEAGVSKDDPYRKDNPPVGTFLTSNVKITSPITRLYFTPESGMYGLTFKGHFFRVIFSDVTKTFKVVVEDLRSSLGLQANVTILEIRENAKEKSAMALVKSAFGFFLMNTASRGHEALPKTLCDDDARKVVWMRNGLFWRLIRGNVYVAASLFGTMENALPDEDVICEDGWLVAAARFGDPTTGEHVASVSKSGQVVVQKLHLATGKSKRTLVGWVPGRCHISAATVAECGIKVSVPGKKAKVETARLIVAVDKECSVYAREILPGGLNGRFSPLPVLVPKVGVLGGVGVTGFLTATKMSTMSQKNACLNAFYIHGMAPNRFWSAKITRDVMTGELACCALDVRVYELGGGTPCRMMLRECYGLFQVYIGCTNGKLFRKMSVKPEFEMSFSDFDPHPVQEGMRPVPDAITAMSSVEYTDGAYYLFVASLSGIIGALRDIEDKGLEELPGTRAEPHPKKTITAMETRPHAGYVCVMTAASDCSFALSVFHRKKLTMEVLWRSQLSIERIICIAAGYNDPSSTRHYVMAIGRGMEAIPICKKPLLAYTEKHGFSLDPPE